MLILTRKKNEVRIGVDAPKDVPVHRREVKETIDKEAAAVAADNPNPVE